MRHQTLTNIGASVAATRGRGFYLAIPLSKDFLGLGSLLKPLNVSEDDFHQCLAALTLPRRVIESLGGGGG